MIAMFLKVFGGDEIVFTTLYYSQNWNGLCVNCDYSLGIVVGL